MKAYENSYWNNKGKYQEIADRLQNLIPAQGKCVDSKTINKNLDLFRRASNCYYDLFNNGLCNRASEFRSVFGFSPKTAYLSYRSGRRSIDFQNEEMNTRLNAKLDQIILCAAFEQCLL